mmetsp:Transcript_27231/g.88008  ORF Transcript_27231/g.88008 Transcript_27231/m.88008 type:complete len:236 (+) Transcript_27231:709-1416(+)
MPKERKERKGKQRKGKRTGKESGQERERGLASVLGLSPRVGEFPDVSDEEEEHGGSEGPEEHAEGSLPRDGVYDGGEGEGAEADEGLDGGVVDVVGGGVFSVDFVRAVFTAGEADGEDEVHEGEGVGQNDGDDEAELVQGDAGDVVVEIRRRARLDGVAGQDGAHEVRKFRRLVDRADEGEAVEVDAPHEQFQEGREEEEERPDEVRQLHDEGRRHARDLGESVEEEDPRFQEEE